MAQIDLKKQNNILIPSLPQDEEILNKWKNGDILRADIRKPRNIKFHRKFFALLDVIYNNQDKYDNRDDLRTEITLRTGFYKEHVTAKGTLIYVPMSIAFSNMDELKFSQLYDKAIDICIKYFCQGSTKEEIDNKVLEVLNFS